MLSMSNTFAVTTSVEPPRHPNDVKTVLVCFIAYRSTFWDRTSGYF